MHYDNVRMRVAAALTEEEALDIHKQMTERYEKDTANESFFQ